MVKRIFTILLIFGVATFIVYISRDLVANKDPHHPHQWLGTVDGKIWIFNHLDEVDFNNIPLSFSETEFSILNYYLDQPERLKRMYLSENREIMILESPSFWKDDHVNHLLQALGRSARQINKKTWKCGEIDIFRFKSFLIVQHQKESRHSNEIDWHQFDPNASYNIIQFDDFKPQHQDFYRQENGWRIYTSQHTQKKDFSAVNDRVLFANYLPSTIDQYHFLTKEWALSATDSLAKHPMNNWVQTGFVHFKLGSQEAWLLDLPPTLNLSDLFPDASGNTAEIKGGNPLGRVGKTNETWYARQLDAYLYLSDSPAFLSDIVAKVQLEQTLGTQKKLLQSVYSLNQRTTERKWSKEQTESKAVYGSKLLTQRFIPTLDHQMDQTSSSKVEVQTHDMGEWVSDFWVDPSNQSIWAATEKGELILKEASGKEQKWKGLGDYVGAWYNGQNQMIFTFKNTLVSIGIGARDIHQTNLNQMPLGAATGVNMGRKQLYVVNLGTSIQVISHSGKVEKTVRVGNPISQDLSPVIWRSQNQWFLGYKSDQSFFMLRYDNLKEYRNFPLGKSPLIYPLPNELQFLSSLNNAWIIQNQKGQELSRFNLQWALSNASEDIAVLGSNKQVEVVNIASQKTLFKSTLSTGFQPQSAAYSRLSDKAILSLLNDLKNEITVCELPGGKVLQKLKGIRKVSSVLKNSKSLSIYTIQDSFIVQYVVHLN